MVSKIMREDELGEVEVYEEKEIVERLIAQNFTEIYKIPPHMRIPANQVDFDV